jgi:excisionase family DNA binding protein
MDRLLLRPVEAADMIGIGRSKVYALLASGELPSIRIGCRVRVPVAELRNWIEGKTRERVDGRNVVDGPDEGRPRQPAEGTVRRYHGVLARETQC